MDRLAETFLNWEVMARYAPKILEGTWVTIQLALAVVVAGIAAGLFLAVVRAFRIKPLNALIVLVVDVMRALPPLVVIVIFYFALPTSSGSSALVGSSNMRIAGSSASARAMATRCCCPPESSLG